MQTKTQKPKSSCPPDIKTELYVVMPDEGTLADQSSRLMTALDRLKTSVVLLPSPSRGDSESDDNTGALKDLVARLQSRDIAVMVKDDPKLARDIGADGVHMDWRTSIVTDYEAARGLGGGQMMIGAVAGKSRHDAMLLAETGADYIAFGVPSTLKDQETARARQLELIVWWAETFEIPVVAFDIATPEQAAAVKQAGADFIAATLPPNSTDQAQFEAWLTAFANLFTASQNNA